MTRTLDRFCYWFKIDNTYRIYVQYTILLLHQKSPCWSYFSLLFQIEKKEQEAKKAAAPVKSEPVKKELTSTSVPSVSTAAAESEAETWQVDFSLVASHPTDVASFILQGHIFVFDFCCHSNFSFQEVKNKKKKGGRQPNVEKDVHRPQSDAAADLDFQFDNELEQASAGGYAHTPKREGVKKPSRLTVWVLFFDFNISLVTFSLSLIGLVRT